jgi:uncharacterized protein (TIGR02246 family)
MAESTFGGVRDTIVAANEVFMTRFRQRDAAGMAALYTEDGQVMPPNADFVTGREGIQVFWQALMDMGIQEALIETGEVEDHGETLIEVSRFTLHGEGGAELDRGKYIVIWKRVDGEWKLHRDIFNSSMPPPG